MPKTKLQIWCEGVIEAGWLAALIVAPLYFNVYSSRVFEPDKISLVRTIALVMLLAYLLRLADGGRAWLVAYSSSAGLLDGPADEETNAGDQDAADQAGGGWIQRLLRIPLLLPVLLTVLSYGISTLFSVAPHVSWWGSYQRLQGAYTVLSYVVIAVLTAAHLRRPEQLRRLQYTVIITSLPIAIYGIVQHYSIDPLPWGGDVVTRISGNAGNPIFLAAYLIMAVFLTLERIYSSFAYLLTVDTGQNGEGGSHDGASALAGGSYLFIFIVQLLAIFWTQSRGPWLGLFLGLYLFVLLLITGLRPARYRAMTISWVGLGLFGAVFLVLINVTSLARLVEPIPYAGRLTTILEQEGTGKVRLLIWEGVSQMVSPHDPIIFPDGNPDALNPIRPLIGYGPEAMWVAFNNFYPPDLAHVEARNASPDRSHNETWDSLAITGAFGFTAYVLLFFMIFYWSLRWLGLIANRRDLGLFLGLWLGGGLLLSAIFTFFDQSWRYFGVALPTGFMLGLIVYVTLAVFLHPEVKIEKADARRQLLIVAILATIAAHFMEIHFGIAIAATRTYFWVMGALLLALGMRWVQPESFASEAGTVQATAPTDSGPSGGGRRAQKRRQRARRAVSGPAVERLPSLPSTLVPDLLIFLTLVYLYTTNFFQMDSPVALLFRSITARSVDGEEVRSPAILFLLLFTWLIAATIGLAVEALRQRQEPGLSWWLRGYALHGVVIWTVWLLYGLVQAGRLAPGAAGSNLTNQLEHIAGHFSLYTWLVVLWALLAAVAFGWFRLRERRPVFVGRRAPVSMVAGTVLAIVMFVVVSSVNVALVKADIFYKQGQQFESGGDWISSIELYRRALGVRPTEDHYMLFLGRSLLERAKQAPPEGSAALPADLDVATVLHMDAQQVSQIDRTDLLRAAEAILLRAQDVNPLNTDHTANLARLYRSWADLATDPEDRQRYLEKSLEHYDMAITLSPNAAHLWNERGVSLLMLGDEAGAETAYRHSLSLDQKFENTYLLMAEFYERQNDYDKVQEILAQGIREIPGRLQLQSYLSVALARSGQYTEAIQVNLEIIDRQPADLTAARNLAILYRDAGQPEEAVRWTQRAVDLAGGTAGDPQTVVPLYRLLAELHQVQGNAEQVMVQYERLRQVVPQDPQVLNELVTLYLQSQRVDEAVETLQTLAVLEPDDYLHPYRLAQILHQTGQLDAARQFAQQAYSLAPETERQALDAFLASLQS